MNYPDKLAQDLIGQFQNQPRTEILLAALGRQLQEVAEVYQDLQEQRNLASANGQQLDRIGEIVALDRTQAQSLLSSVGQVDSELAYERYRNLLRWKILINTSACTYYHLIQALKMLWPDTEIYYSEDLNYPATLFFAFNTLDRQGNPVVFKEIPLVHPAGVAAHYHFMTKVVDYWGSELTYLEPTPLICGTFISGKKFCGNNEVNR